MKNYKYLIFEEIKVKTKTKKFAVKNKTASDLLGCVKWYAPFRKYCYFTEFKYMVFDTDCLADIQDFINTLMIERRNIGGIKNGK